MDLSGGLRGNSMKDALRILHYELESTTQDFEADRRRESWRECWHRFFLNRDNQTSPLHWTGAVLVVGVAFVLFVACALHPENDAWLAVEAIVLLGLLAGNVSFLCWDHHLREGEHLHKARSVLTLLKACIRDDIWKPGNFLDAHCPLSPCVSVQWTLRDGAVVNLPSALLVEGDVILLRPGQLVPAKCRPIKEGEVVELNEGEMYQPTQTKTSADQIGPHTKSTRPLRPRPFLVLETPFVSNLRSFLKTAQNRPTSFLNKERFNVYSAAIEKFGIPSLLLVMLLVGALRLFLLGASQGHWTMLLLVQQVHVALPLLPLTLPVLWKILDAYGTAKVLVMNRYTKQMQPGCVTDFHSDTLSHESILQHEVGFRDVWQEFCSVLLGNCDALPRTVNILHVLGNVTSLCCVDKKGVLSWPNPTAEKVFFLVSKEVEKKKKMESSSSLNEEQEEEEGEGESPGVCSSSGFQVLDLTQDPDNAYGLQFDDPSWRNYINSLKPLGLDILLNTCNSNISSKYTEFADHVTCTSLKRECEVPVVNRRCFCELSRQIGFGEQASDLFKTDLTLGIYRHLPPPSETKDHLIRSRSSVIKYKMPMPNMFSVVATDTMTGMNQLFSQGTADLLLDTCSDFWDGQDLMPLAEQDRKKISDFYHRTSMSSYCTAFAYRPITNVLGREFGSMYLEMGSDTQNTRPSCLNSTGARSWDDQSLGSSKLCNDLPAHLSADSLIQGASMESIHETMGCLSAQCNQIFIGMITMQYQAKQEVVELIDALEGACIRFVHFSKENELRSRVFSEKMGLEAGWNCHISLLSEASPDADTSGRGASHSSLSATSHLSPRSVDSLSYQEAKEGRSAITLQRRSSAPSAVHLEAAQVKFEAEKRQEYEAVHCSSPLLQSDENGDHLASIESFPASSHMTETTDSTGMSFSNRSLISEDKAKLPKGIENIRPHIESVDNVPLQVSLFTDCTPDTTQEMLIIFQEYGEVVCCLGSTANIHNTQLFLQADASLGLEPQFPQVCVRREAMSERWDPLGQTGIPSPYELSSRLLGLPCSLTYSQDDSLSVLPLIAVARHHCHGVRSALLLLLMSQLGLALLQFLGAVLLLPPVLPPRLLLWLSGVIVPLLCLCLLCNPIDLQVAKMAQAKKPKDALSLRAVLEFLTLYCVRFVPSILISLVCFGVTLHSLCQQLSPPSNSTSCHVIFGDQNYNGSSFTWNGWTEQYSHGLILAQNILAFQLLLYIICISLCYLQRFTYLWQKSPLLNIPWCCTALFLLILQAIYFAIDVHVSNAKHDTVVTLASVPMATWITAFLWLFILIPSQEVIKYMEIKAWVRHQKRARLDFGTKLGMNSPF